MLPFHLPARPSRKPRTCRRARRQQRPKIPKRRIRLASRPPRSARPRILSPVALPRSRNGEQPEPACPAGLARSVATWWRAPPAAIADGTTWNALSKKAVGESESMSEFEFAVNSVLTTYIMRLIPLRSALIINCVISIGGGFWLCLSNDLQIPQISQIGGLNC